VGRKALRKGSRSPRCGGAKSGLQREVIDWVWVALVFFADYGTIGQARVIPSG